ncbi:1-deoxy-D-xylulose-5-phosphate reductoisomerase [Paenibacillus sepulcri]|uniref:1-deoxy-D-xylulose 5-phosphate reductoisomerase n=1 Tax=Paenibacillus sepulcri TaxID=359917 RepID=A0ABS7BW41_9BACL|nr:1-deoxy-D-xylulose-5-phosphate reductoisomerase [Paenibacillus sepulcri]
MKKISILGSSGSIGKSTLDVVRKHPDRFKISGLAANQRIDDLIEQAHEFRPTIVSVGNRELARKVKAQVDDSVMVCYGEKGLIDVACCEEADLVMNSVTGATGIIPTIKALHAGKDVAIANKETLVAAGCVVTKLAKEKGCKLIPVDSEHSAIYQCLNGESRDQLSKLIITASGGAFRDLTKQEMTGLRASDALKHPNWSMGEKITIDCATLMNKGFEVIEAHWLFEVPYEQIEVLIHRQSVIHSMVEFVDGSIIAQMGMPDMRVPIQYALEYPNRLKSDYPKLDLSLISQLNFEKPDMARFPCLSYAFEAGKQGGTMPAVLNAANEVVNFSFRRNEACFSDFEKILDEVLSSHHNIQNPQLEDILHADAWAREKAELLIKRQS